MSSFTDMVGGGGEAAESDRFVAAEHIDELIAVVKPVKKEISTSRGPSDAASCQYLVIMEGDQAGRVFDDQLLWGTVVVPTLTESQHMIVVGRLTKGKAKGGQNAPWLWVDATPAEFTEAGEWFEANASIDDEGNVKIEAQF